MISSSSQINYFKYEWGFFSFYFNIIDARKELKKEKRIWYNK